ncbi:MAG: hypothetical protein J0M08_05675 [Bacteroidetes bacterium]|nr:hypothetical protein [Bacteroidota bacterium]
MINPNLKQEFLNEAIRIGDELLLKAKVENETYYWETASLDYASGSASPGIKWIATEGIYNGTSGILLFFLELYKHTTNEKYIPYIHGGANWLIAKTKKEETDYYALITGRTGVSYTLLKIGQVLKNKKYITQAVEIIKDCEKFLVANKPIEDVLNGIAGTILGLLHLYDETKDESLLRFLNNYIAKLISQTHFSEKGIYWDRSYQQIRGLCGFSHGAAGIGAVFFELAHYFKNPTFNELGELAFEYENQFYNPQYFNWPDFRKGFYSEEDYTNAEEALKTNDKTYFTKPGYMSAWCHGAPGIGLARWRAHQLTNNKEYLQDALNATKNTVLTELGTGHSGKTFSLCHGKGGNADIFIDAYLITQSEEYLNYSLTAAEMALKHKKEGNLYHSGYSTFSEEDTSLYMGNAGIGYFYLRTLFPKSVDSITFPTLKNQVTNNDYLKYNFITISAEELRKILLSKIFPRTLHHLESSKKEYISGKLKTTTFYQIKSELLNNPTLFVEDNSLQKEILTLEKEKHLLDATSISNAYLYALKYFNGKNYQQWINKQENERTQTYLQFDPTIKKLQLEYDITLNNSEQEKEETYIYLIPNYMGVTEWKVSPLIEAIGDVFKESKTIATGINELVDLFDTEGNEAESVKAKDLVKNQIYELLKSGILSIQS